MIKLGKWITKHRVIILIVAVVLLIPSVLGMIATRINYDMLNYLPDTMETIQGQDILLNDFGKGAFSMIIVEDMEPKDVSALKEKPRPAHRRKLPAHSSKQNVPLRKRKHQAPWPRPKGRSSCRIRQFPDPWFQTPVQPDFFSL